MPPARTVVSCMLVAGIVVSAAASPAAAHAILVSSEPPAGATVDGPPGEVVLRFNEEVEAQFAQIQVQTPAGERADAGEPTRTPDRQGMTVGLLPVTEPGTYQVAYRVVSADGHPVEGAFSFTVSEGAVAPDPAPDPATPEPTPARTPATTAPPAAQPSPDAPPEPPPGSGPPVLPVALAALVALAAVGFFVALRGRGPT